MINKNIVKVFFIILIGLEVTGCGTSTSTQKDNTEMGNQVEELSLKNRAVDVSLHPIDVAKSTYSFELKTDTPSPTQTAKSSVAVWGNFSKTGEEKIVLEMHDGYADGSKLQVLVRDSSENIVGKSHIFEFNSEVEDLEFGEILLGD